MLEVPGMRMTAKDSAGGECNHPEPTKRVMGVPDGRAGEI